MGFNIESLCIKRYLAFRFASGAAAFCNVIVKLYAKILSLATWFMRVPLLREAPVLTSYGQGRELISGSKRWYMYIFKQKKTLSHTSQQLRSSNRRLISAFVLRNPWLSFWTLCRPIFVYVRRTGRNIDFLAARVPINLLIPIKEVL